MDDVTRGLFKVKSAEKWLRPASLTFNTSDYTAHDGDHTDYALSPEQPTDTQQTSGPGGIESQRGRRTQTGPSSSLLGALRAPNSFCVRVLVVHLSPRLTFSLLYYMHTRTLSLKMRIPHSVAILEHLCF